MVFSGITDSLQESGDFFDENPKIFIEQKENCRLLKISRFSGRNPDIRYYFLSAYAAKKYERDVHAVALDFTDCSV